MGVASIGTGGALGHAIQLASSKDNGKMVNALLRAGVDPSVMGERYGEDALYNAISKRRRRRCSG
jgi:hypothetical protein